MKVGDKVALSVGFTSPPTYHKGKIVASEVREEGWRKKVKRTYYLVDCGETLYWKALESLTVIK